jgi:hypothetical protein
MKIRQGFVSNSSSSSFCIYGACVSDHFCEDEIEEMENKISAEGFEVHYMCDYGGIYVGRDWSSVKDDETGAQFKTSVEKSMKELFDGKVKCSTCEAAWRDG